MRKHNVLQIFLGAEIVIFLLFYYGGNQGLRSVFVLADENKKISLEIEETKQEIIALENTIKTWQSDSFYKEKLAREELHMAKENEQVYLV